jgi:hypothetical protein
MNKKIKIRYSNYNLYNNSIFLSEFYKETRFR